MAREWKLGNDLLPCDNILDGITFEDVILAVHCNCQEITRAAVLWEARMIAEQRMQDYKYILANNINEIIERAKEGRGEYEFAK